MSSLENVIYKVTCKSTGKCYIGKAKNWDKRWYMHLRNVGKIKSPFYNAIKRYGIEDFTVEILHCVDKYEDLDKLEVECIKYHNSLYPLGYNLTKGGTGGDVITNHPDRAQLNDARKGRAPWNKGKKFPSSWNKGTKGIMKPNKTTFKSGEEHRFYKKKQSEQTIERRKQTMREKEAKGIKRRVTVRAIYVQFHGKVYHYTSIKEATKELNLVRDQITYALIQTEKGREYAINGIYKCYYDKNIKI